MPHTLIPHVEQTRLSALQLRLESISGLSVDFLVLLACSTVIATFGLFQNSAAVIIGAMIIAPLMRPLVCLSLSTLTADTKLLSRALITLIVGTIMGVAISATMALFLRSLELTPEILGRTHPTLLDLGVALFAGAIGAYCQTDKSLSNSLAGVAIAVALVPPLSVIATVFANGETINSHQVKLVQDFLSREMRSPVEFRLRIIPSTELSAVEVNTESNSGTISQPISQTATVVSPTPEQTSESEQLSTADSSRKNSNTLPESTSATTTGSNKRSESLESTNE